MQKVHQIFSLKKEKIGLWNSVNATRKPVFWYDDKGEFGMASLLPHNTLIMTDDFRILADKYIEDFNNLVAVARESERAGTLLALISGSDIGKVYYILAKALGKVD